MTWEWWAASIGGPSAGPFIVRRAWWWLCVGAGWVDDLRGERELADDKTAFANGRAYVFQTARHLARLQFERIDWRGLALGFLLSCKHFHTVCAMTWAGVKRDARVFRDWVVNRGWQTPRLHPDTVATLANIEQAKTANLSSDAKAALIAANIDGLHMRLRVLGRTPHHERSRDEVYEHEYLASELNRHYDAAPQALLSPVTALAGGLSWKLAAASAGLAVVFFGLWRHDEGAIGRIKGERDAASASLESYKAGVDERDKRITALRTEVTAQNVQCVTETQEAADRREAQTRRRLAAESKARGKINEASSGAARPFDLGERLRALSEDDPGAGPAGGGGPAS